MSTRHQTLLRSLALTVVLSVAPVSFAGLHSGSGSDLLSRNAACAEEDKCCFEPFSLCGDRPNLAACTEPHCCSGGR
jgi:hypothetical protein